MSMRIINTENDECRTLNVYYLFFFNFILLPVRFYIAVEVLQVNDGIYTFPET